MGKKTWRWVRNAAARNETAWRARLSFLQPGSLVVHGHPGKTRIRIETYAANPAELRLLAQVFGGKVETFDPEQVAARANAPRRPLRIGSTFGVLDVHGKWPGNTPRPRILLRVGSAMAFGTGEHATTSACLRFLAKETKTCSSDWTCLDLGTGSGILAVAAEKLGARKVLGLDYDPRAVKAAKACVTRNRCRRVRIEKKNLLTWKPGRTRHRIVLANVFSEILRAAAPQIVRSVAAGGCLVLSGILRPQEKEVMRTFRAQGMECEDTARRGKWVTLLLRAR